MRSKIFILISCFSFSTFGFLLSQDAFLDSLALTLDLSEVVITGQHAPTHYTRALQNIQVLKLKEMQDRGFTQLDEALSLSPTIRIEEDPILGSTVKMRGIESSNVAILIDGVPVIGRLDGAIDLSQISLNNVDRIEIVEGPQSVLYGNNAAGGVINIITKKSQVNNYELGVNSQIESTGLAAHNLRLGLKKGDFHVAVTGKYLEDQLIADDSLRVYETLEFTNGQTLSQKKYPWNPKIQKNIGSMLRYNFDDESYLILRYDLNTEVVRNLGELRRPQFKPYAFDEKYNTNRQDFSLQYKTKIKDQFFADAILAYNNFDRFFLQERFEFELNQIDEEQTSIDTSAFNSLFAKATFSSNWDKKVNFLVGAQLNQESGFAERLKFEEKEGEATSILSSIFADLKYKPKNTLEGSLGARFSSHSSYGFNFSPAFQMKWNPKERWTLRAGYARGFRSPELKELYLSFIDVNHFVLGNEALIPELVGDLNLSLSNQWTLDKTTLDLKAKLYHSDIKEKIILVEYEPAQYQYENLDNYTVMGTGLGGQLTIKTFTIQSDANLGFWSNNVSQTESVSNYSSTFDLSSRISYSLPETKINMSLSHRFIGALPRYYLDTKGGIQESIAASYHLIDASSSIRFWKSKIQLVGGVKNLLNLQRTDITNRDLNGNHALDTSNSNQLISKGRTAFVSLSVNLNK